ncbi:hypothetical protein LIER_01888 [Lithospermum erythrorhizon]|uniref:Uncharacterized protein n=1 Tax=Lithospermum erythrorhizon TaxID=34254 RepID=A0AAV3NR97_LITER
MVLEVFGFLRIRLGFLYQTSRRNLRVQYGNISAIVNTELGETSKARGKANKGKKKKQGGENTTSGGKANNGKKQKKSGENTTGTTPKNTLQLLMNSWQIGMMGRRNLHQRRSAAGTSS